MATISIAIVDCQNGTALDVTELSEMIAKTKKQAKQSLGDSIVKNPICA